MDCTVTVENVGTSEWITAGLVPLLAAFLGASIGAIVAWIVHKRDIDQQRERDFRVAVTQLLEAAMLAQTPAYIDHGMTQFAPIPDYRPRGRALQMQAFAATLVAPKNPPPGLIDGLDWVAEIAAKLGRGDLSKVARIAFLNVLPDALRNADPETLAANLRIAQEAFHGKNARSNAPDDPANPQGPTED